MKKIIFTTVVLFTLSLFIVSCSSESDVLSSFSKRKYLKNFKTSKTELDKSNENYTAEKASVESKTNDVATITNEPVVENNPIIAKIPTTISYSDIAKIQASTPKKVAKQIKEEYRNWDKFNRNYSSEFLASTKEYNLIKSKNSAAKVDDVVLIILGIFIPPLAVYLYEDAVTGNFWIDLLLTFLFWFPGIIFALLVMFAGVSI